MVGCIQRQGLILRCRLTHAQEWGLLYNYDEQMAPVECNLNTQDQSTPQNQLHYTYNEQNPPDHVHTSRENNTADCLKGDRREGRLVEVGLRGGGAGDKRGHS